MYLLGLLELANKSFQLLEVVALDVRGSRHLSPRSRYLYGFGHLDLVNLLADIGKLERLALELGGLLSKQFLKLSPDAIQLLLAVVVVFLNTRGRDKHFAFPSFLPVKCSLPIPQS